MTEKFSPLVNLLQENESTPRCVCLQETGDLTLIWWLVWLWLATDEENKCI